MMDLIKIREQFPILNQKINNCNLIYFDNAATSQKPISVIESISDFYKKSKTKPQQRTSDNSRNLWLFGFILFKPIYLPPNIQQFE